MRHQRFTFVTIITFLKIICFLWIQIEPRWSGNLLQTGATKHYTSLLSPNEFNLTLVTLVGENAVMNQPTNALKEDHRIEKAAGSTLSHRVVL